MKSKIIAINSLTCQEVNLFLTRDDEKQAHVLIQAWHWFENAWHYQFDTAYFDYQSLAENFIEDFSSKAADDFAREFTFVEKKNI